MNRDEFEKAYADKYTAGDVLSVFWNRDGEGYTDHHIDLCWKVQRWLTIAEKAPYMSEVGVMRTKQILEW